METITLIINKNEKLFPIFSSMYFILPLSHTSFLFYKPNIGRSQEEGRGGREGGGGKRGEGGLRKRRRRGEGGERGG